MIETYCLTENKLDRVTVADVEITGTIKIKTTRRTIMSEGREQLRRWGDEFRAFMDGLDADDEFDDTNWYDMSVGWGLRHGIPKELIWDWATDLRYRQGYSVTEQAQLDAAEKE